MQFNKIKLPFNLEFEKKLLGSLILTSKIDDGMDYEPILSVQEILGPEDFYDLQNGAVFMAICAIVKEKKPIELVGIFEKTISMNTQISKDTIGQYIGELSQSVITSTNYAYYAAEVKKLSERRHFIRMCWEYSQEASRVDSIDNFLPNFQKKLIEIKNERSNKLIHVKEFIGDVLNDIEEEIIRRQQGDGSSNGLQIGLSDIDKKTGGFQPGNQIIIAARPGEGKTAFTGQICANIAQQGNVIIFSYEMSKKELAKRLISCLGEINIKKARTKEDGSLMLHAGEQIERLNIYIDDSKPTWDQLEIRCKRFSYEFDISAIMIDYLQLIPSMKNMSRYESVTEMSRRSKVLAGELGSVNFVISQLGRDTEKRAGKGQDFDRPKLSDLRDSGAIEQDADIVLFLHRDKRFNDYGDINNEVEVICDKHRNGEIFEVTFKFERWISKFVELEFSGTGSMPF